MKKSIFMSLLAAVSLGMATVSCSSDNTEDEQGGSGSGKMETYTISCSFDNDTRMVLDADASPRKYKWETGDEITIFNANGTKLTTATLTGGAGTNNGTFTFSTSGDPKYMTFMSGGTRGAAAANGIRITIDPVQTYASTGTAIADLPIMAQGELTKIGTNKYRGALKHKMSFIKFGTITCNGNPTALTISGTRAAKIDPKTGNITPVATTAYTNSTIPAANVTSGNMIAVFPGFDFSAEMVGVKIMDNPTINDNLIYTLDRPLTGYTITYDRGYGTAGEPVTELVTPGYKIKDAPSDFYNDNKDYYNSYYTPTTRLQFANNWNTEKDGTGTSYAVGASYDSPTENLTLYAQWQLGNPYIQWNAYEYWGTGNNTWGRGNYGGDNTTELGVSKYSTVSCHMISELSTTCRRILFGTSYWDDSTVPTERQSYPTFFTGNTLYHTGIWIQEEVTTPTGFQTVTPASNTPVKMSTLSASQVAAIRSGATHFFVPAASRYNASGTFELSNVGKECYIWTNRHDLLTTAANKAEIIHANANKVEVYSEYIRVGALEYCWRR